MSTNDSSTSSPSHNLFHLTFPQPTKESPDPRPVMCNYQGVQRDTPFSLTKETPMSVCFKILLARGWQITQLPNYSSPEGDLLNYMFTLPKSPVEVSSLMVLVDQDLNVHSILGKPESDPRLVPSKGTSIGAAMKHLNRNGWKLVAISSPPTKVDPDVYQIQYWS